MKIKNKTEFLRFSDGVVKLYRTDTDDEIIRDSLREYHFGDRRVGVNRYYAARQNDVELVRLIHIHRNTEVDTQYAAVINNTRYKIEQIQQEPDTNPPCTVLSLSQRGLWEGREHDDD